MKFLILMGWQVFVLWGVLNVGFALQVIERVTLPIGNQDQCTALQLPIQAGRCSLLARAEGNYDRTWTYFALDKPFTEVRQTEQVPMLYDPADWRIQGGVFSGVGLVVLAALLSLGPVLAPWWQRGRRTKLNKKTYQ